MKKRSARRSNSPLLLLLAFIFCIAGLTIFFKTVSSQTGSTLGTTSFLLAKNNDSGDDSSDNSGSGSSGGNSDSSNDDEDDDADENINDTDDEEVEDNTGGTGSSGASSPTLRTRTQFSTGVRTRVETKEDESRTEVRLGESERIRVRTEDGRSRIDITSGGVKTRLEFRDGRVVVKAEQNDGDEEIELEDTEDTLLKIEERLDDDDIKIATDTGDRFILTRGNARAVTDFPLSIDLATNTLFVNTPGGQQPLRVLPDAAIQNLIAANVVNRIGGQAIADLARNGNLTAIADVITLGEQNGIPIYEINGLSDQRLLGFIPVEIPKAVTLSADTGEVISTELSPLSQLLDLLSL